MKTFLLFIFYISCVLFAGCSGEKKKMSSGVVQNEIFNLEETFVPKYNIVQTEDISYKEEGIRIARILYRVTFPKGLSYTDIYDSFRYLAKKTYDEKGIKNISIFAYYPDDKIDSPYTIGMFEANPAQDNNPKLIIADSYFKEDSIQIEKGNIIVLNTKEEYDKKAGKFIAAQRTKISNNPSDFNDCDYVPNGTEAKIVDIFRKRLTSNYTWISYKVYIKKINREVWVSDDCVKKSD